MKLLLSTKAPAAWLSYIALSSLLLSSCAAPFEGEPEPRPAALGGDSAHPAEDALAAMTSATAALDLATCLDLARRNSRGLSIARRRVLIADDRVDEAIASMLPRLSATGRFEARDSDPGVERNGQAFAFGNREIGTFQASAIVPLYAFGRAENTYDARSHAVAAARLDAKAQRLAVELDVRLAYFRLLESEKIAQIVVSSRETLRTQRRIARDFYGEGLVAKNDVLATEVELARRDQELIRARTNIELARATLNRLLGFDVSRPTRVVDVLEAEPWSGSFVSVLSAALDNRPDLGALRKRVEVAQADYKATRSELLPVIYAFGSYNYTTDDVQINQSWFSGGAAIEIPIFDGGATWTRLWQRRRQIEQAIDLRDGRSEDVVLEVKVAHLRHREQAQRIPVARRSISLAQENLRVVKDQYSQGLVSSADVLREEERLTRSRVSYFRALYTSHSAFARLVRAAGGSLSSQSVQ